MITLLLNLLRVLPVFCGGHRQLALENLALRQQLAVYKRTVARPRLRTSDRLFWVERLRGHNKAVVALANKLARIVRGVWRHGTDYVGTPAV